jgi:XTP/dITP diphosphohydrolase
MATGNAGKVREFRDMLGHDRYEWADLSSLPSPPEVEETGRTFRENACLKASTYAKHYQLWALADDSGLEVDALNGSPGVVSARWAELHNAGRGDRDNNILLLKQLNDISDDRRAARFVCVLALSNPSGEIILTTRDTIEGQILREPRGNNGFGYDPLFFIPSLGRTSAELSPVEKHEISHRGKALRRMRELMDRVSLERASV